jgi:flagellar biosynthesis/type III secretory pathway protein FliH
VDDLRSATDEALAARTGSAYLRLVLWSLRLRGEAPEPERIEAWTEQFRALLATGDPAELESVLRYHVEVSGDRASHVIDAVTKADPGVREAYMSEYDRIVEEGRQKGREEGRREGREEGRQEGRGKALVSMLSKLLERKFGAMTQATRDRLASAPPDQLERWAERVLAATSIEEVFATNGRSP